MCLFAGRYLPKWTFIELPFNRVTDKKYSTPSRLHENTKGLGPYDGHEQRSRSRRPGVGLSHILRSIKARPFGVEYVGPTQLCRRNLSRRASS